MATIQKNCKKCEVVFHPKLADVKRGWGKFCSKSCKAKTQEQKTGQYKHYIHKKNNSNGNRVIKSFDDGTELFYANFSNEENSDV